VNFGEILDQWESKAPAVPYNKDSELEERGEKPAARRRRLLRKSPDESIDLHGMTVDQAWTALEGFFDSARNRGLEKLLIIHGKGNHAGASGEAAGGASGAAGDGKLKNMVRTFIERCPFAGQSGYSGASDGGTGSTWVLLKAPVSVPGK